MWLFSSVAAMIGSVAQGQKNQTFRPFCIQTFLKPRGFFYSLHLKYGNMWVQSSTSLFLNKFDAQQNNGGLSLPLLAGNYCAANAFMDTFGARRRAKQLPAISLQWGPWAEVGMAARAGTSEGPVEVYIVMFCPDFFWQTQS